MIGLHKVKFENNVEWSSCVCRVRLNKEHQQASGLVCVEGGRSLVYVSTVILFTILLFDFWRHFLTCLLYVVLFEVLNRWFGYAIVTKFDKFFSIVLSCAHTNILSNVVDLLPPYLKFTWHAHEMHKFSHWKESIFHRMDSRDHALSYYSGEHFTHKPGRFVPIS